MSRYQQKRPPYLIYSVVLLLAVLLVYKVWGSFSASQDKPAPPTPEVTIKEVQPQNIPLTFEYAGRTAGSREVEIRARVSGILQKRAYVEGQWVKRGTVLFKIDPAPFQATLAQAQARLTQTRSERNRAVRLLKEKALSQREYDEARSAYEQAEAEAKTARINLDYTTVTAPINGVTSKEGLSEGSLVVADNSLLTRLTQLNPIYVEFSIPDAEAISQRQWIASGAVTLPEDKKLTAEIHLGDGSVFGQKGTVDFTDSIIDPNTGTVATRAVVPNADKVILPGQFVRVVIRGMTRANAISLPDQAIMQGPQGTFVYAVGEDGKAKVKPVTLGGLNGESRIIQEGLQAGDKVIVEGMIKVKPDMPVKIAPPKEKGADDKAAPQNSAEQKKG